jgi:hypothetical protein
MIVFNVFNACCLLHNSILGRKEVDVEELMQVIQIEAMQMDYNKMKTMFTLKVLALKGTTSSQLRDVPCCSMLLKITKI